MWIRYDVPIDFPVYRTLQNTMQEAEMHDKNHDYHYFACASAIDVLAKNEYNNGNITEEQWDALINRYPEEGCTDEDICFEQMYIQQSETEHRSQ